MTTRKPSVPVTPEQAQFEIWPEPQRALPNVFARSALFRVGHPAEPRDHYRRQLVASVGGFSITYTGDELRQDDEDVFLQITHLARLQPLGTIVQFTAHSMIVELGWTCNSESYERLRNCFDRLKATALTVALQDGSRGYSGSLIRAFQWIGQDGRPMQRWQILLEPEILALYGPTTMSRLEWRMRLALPPLAKWLHGFYSTHAVPFSYSVAKLKELCGSRIKELRQFRYKLRQALELLVERGFLLSARIDTRSDLVHVERSPRVALIAAM
jgi:hypothetical protein